MNSKTIILLIILKILIDKRIKSIENLYNKTDYWNGYKLGDIYSYWNNLKYQNNDWEYINSIKNKYPNSIGDIYLKKIKLKKVILNY